jgi:CubicO group peptidase (beta-lactamase class C family)
MRRRKRIGFRPETAYSEVSFLPCTTGNMEAGRNHNWISVAAAILASACASAQTPADRLDELARDYFESAMLNGGLLVAHGDFVIYRAAFGLAHREENAPNRTDTVHPVHSITKSFTAVLILQLVEEGEIELEGNLRNYVPSLPSSVWDEVTIHQLLSHRSGIPDYFYGDDAVYPGCSEERTLPRDVLLREVASQPLEFPPGEGFSYSNTGYALLGQVIELTTGKTYNDALRERILDPLGMADTRWVSSVQDPGIVRQYLSDTDGEAPMDVVHPGQSGIVTTLDDMLLFARALGSPDLVSPEMWQLAFTPHSFPQEAGSQIPPHLFPHGYGFALAEFEIAGQFRRAVLHGGSGCGGSALYYRVLDSYDIVILWNNRGDVLPTPSMAPEILSLIY